MSGVVVFLLFPFSSATKPGELGASCNRLRPKVTGTTTTTTTLKMSYNIPITGLSTNAMMSRQNKQTNQTNKQTTKQWQQLQNKTKKSDNQLELCVSYTPISRKPHHFKITIFIKWFCMVLE